MKDQSIALSISRNIWFCGTMSSIRNISICSLFLSAFLVIIKNTAFLIFIISKNGLSNSKNSAFVGLCLQSEEIQGISFLFLKLLFPKTVILFPKTKIIMFFILGILSLYHLKPFIYADFDILPLFQKTLLRKITMSVLTPHYPVFCNFRYPPLLPLDTLFMPRKVRKKEPLTYYVVSKLFLL